MLTTKHIKILLQKMNTKKAVGINPIPPELVKLAAASLCQPLTEPPISMCIKQNNFPNNAKIVSVIPLDKGKSNENDMSKFRAASVLITFSKVYEQVIK